MKCCWWLRYCTHKILLIYFPDNANKAAHRRPIARRTSGPSQANHAGPLQVLLIGKTEGRWQRADGVVPTNTRWYKNMVPVFFMHNVQFPPLPCGLPVTNIRTWHYCASLHWAFWWLVVVRAITWNNYNSKDMNKLMPHLTNINNRWYTHVENCTLNLIGSTSI